MLGAMLSYCSTVRISLARRRAATSITRGQEELDFESAREQVVHVKLDAIVVDDRSMAVILPMFKKSRPRLPPKIQDVTKP